MNLDLEERTRLGERFQDRVEYFEVRISLLNRRACLHKDEPCGKRARNVITGMVDVINALGFEVVGDWNAYDCYFRIVSAFEVAEAAERKN